MAFQVGQMVVCIGTWLSPVARQVCRPEPPKKGGIYTIRCITEGYGILSREKMSCLGLEEVSAIVRDTGTELFFAASYFRPIVTPDISVFTAMLNKAPEKVQ